MLIKDSLNFGFETLKKKGIDSYHLDTELILAFSIKKKREWIISHPEFDLSIHQVKRFKKLIARRSKNYPIAYILGYKYFDGLKFKVNKHVLIPRPETEALIEATRRVDQPVGLILDIGTGSGCIAISLANKFPNSQIIASDISKYALNIAKKNARAHNVKNIKFIKSNLLKNIDEKNIDIIIANLPYVSTDWKNESIKYEPKSALYSGKLGLNHYFKLLDQIKKLDFHPKQILLEIDPSQVKSLIEKANSLFKNIKIEIKKDLAGLDRVFIIKLN